MKTKVALLNFAQWLPRAEWEGDVGWSPSIGLSLIASDVKREGFECDPIIIACENKKVPESFFNKKVPESFFTYLQKERYDIIGIHSVGLYYDEYYDSILKKIKEIQPWVKIVVGGPDSVFFLNSNYVDFAVFGAGRQSFIQFLHAIENKSDIEKTPNLFFKKRKKYIDYSGVTIHYDLIEELDPFEPEMKWIVIDSKFKPNFRHGIVIAMLGCSYTRDISKNRFYSNIKWDKIDYNSLFKYRLTERAKQKLDFHFVKRIRGCTFCNIQTDKGYIGIGNNETTDLLIKQMDFYIKNTNIRIFEIHDENPLRYMPELLEKLDANKYLGLELMWDIRANILITLKHKLIKALEIAKRKNIKLFCQSIGFENFSQDQLDIFNKGVKVKDNIEAIKICREMKDKFGDSFEYRNFVHGFILFTPWITLKEVEENVKIFEKYNFYDFFAYPIHDSILKMYKYSPLFSLAKNDNLIDDDFYYLAKWKFKDERVKLIRETLLQAFNENYNQDAYIHYWDKICIAEIKALKSIIKFWKKK